MSGSPDYTTTPNLGLFRPNYDMDDGLWGTHLNANADVLDSTIHALQGSTAGGPFLPLTGGTVSGQLTIQSSTGGSAGLKIAPQGVINVQGHTNTTSDSGAYLMWNKSGANGETALLNQRGGGAGGFTFGEVDSSGNVTSHLAIDGSGNVNATTGTMTAVALQTGTTSGPTWTTGSAAPAATAPVGSLYSRVGGAVGATLYVSRGGGTWAAVAGV